MDATPSLQEEREARIAELEARLASPPRRGVKPLTAVVGILVSLALLWMLRGELAYFFSPRAPLVLGSEGSYDFTKLLSNRYVEVRGVPTRRGAYERDGEATFVIVGLRETPLLVRRAALPGEDWSPGPGQKAPPQPDQRPFAVRGRLLAEGDAPSFSDAFRRLREMGEVRPRDGQLWLLLESRRPGEDLGTLVAAGALVSFLALNGWLLRRRFKRG